MHSEEKKTLNVVGPGCAHNLMPCAGARVPECSQGVGGVPGCQVVEPKNLSIFAFNIDCKNQDLCTEKREEVKVQKSLGRA